jgi:hypothetical protein
VSLLFLMVPSIAQKPPSYNGFAREYGLLSLVVTQYRRSSPRPRRVRCANESVAGNRHGIDVDHTITHIRSARRPSPECRG